MFICVEPCDGLNEDYPLPAQVFKHSVPSWGRVLGGYGTFGRRNQGREVCHWGMALRAYTSPHFLLSPFIICMFMKM